MDIKQMILNLIRKSSKGMYTFDIVKKLDLTLNLALKFLSELETNGEIMRISSAPLVNAKWKFSGD